MPPKAAQRLAQIAVDVVRRVEAEVEDGRPADVALSQLFGEHREYGARDRRFLSDLVFAFFRWKGWTAHAESPERALAMSYYLDADERHPAADLLAGESAPALQPLRNCALEEQGRRAAIWLERGVPFQPEFLVPAWVKTVLHVPAGARSHMDACLQAFQHRPPTWLRIAAGETDAFLREMANLGVDAHRHPTIPAAVAVAGSPPVLGSAAEKKRLRFEIQDLASQCVGLVCAPEPGEQWWDVCAGAGGKALHLADLMGNKGRIVATDVRAASLEQLRRRAKTAGATIIQAQLVGDIKDGSTFDGVLVDAPCSGLGTWSRNPDARWRTEERDVAEKAAVQAELLSRAAGKVKPGGRLIYSVCTITKAETLDVVAAFLVNHPEFVATDPVHPLQGSPVPVAVWVWPWDGPCDGMFISVLKRAS